MYQLYHYYDSTIGAFVNLSDIPIDEASAILAATKETKPNAQCATRSPEYMQRRHEIEEILRTEFAKKGGLIRRKSPHYMVIGSIPWLSTWFENSAHIEIPSFKFDVNTISFTYGDAFPVFSKSKHQMDDKEYRRQVYTYKEIQAIIEKYGYPQNWNDDGTHGPERYIEAHIWCDDVINMYKQALKDLPKMKAIFTKETAIPSIALTAERSEDIAITDSKLGGNPYLPKTFTYPTCSKGHPLKLLAQLNFAQLPKLPDFPGRGILQIYALVEDDIGMNYDHPTKQDTFKVIYHGDISQDHMMDFSEIPSFTIHSPEGWFPFEGEFQLKGSLKDCPMTSSTYEFENTFTRLCTENNVSPTDELKELLWGYAIDWNQHRISGYPHFAQFDRRGDNESLKKYDTLLLQIDTQPNDIREDEIMWGDCGVANFLINREDLKNLNFQDIMYTWDCH